MSIQLEAFEKNATSWAFLNATLAPYLNCPRALDALPLGEHAADSWTAVYLDAAVDRIQAYLRGVDLTYSDVFAMQQLCAYETVSLGYSEFCGLFTQEEWAGFEYASGTFLFVVDSARGELTMFAVHRPGILVRFRTRKSPLCVSRSRLGSRTCSTFNGNAVDELQQQHQPHTVREQCHVSLDTANVSIEIIILGHALTDPGHNL